MLASKDVKKKRKLDIVNFRNCLERKTCMFILFFNKLSLKILIYLFLLLSLFCVNFFNSKLNYISKSKFDPNYWIYSLKNKKGNNISNDIYNLIKISKENKKYKDKAIMNLIFYFDNLNEEEKNIIVNEI